MKYSSVLARSIGHRCLAEIVPFGRGDDVAVLGRAPQLVAHLKQRGMTPVELPSRVLDDGGTLPLPSGSVDHLIVTGTWRDDAPLWAECARVLRPGGTLVAGGRNRARALRDTGAWTARRTRSSLGTAGFANVMVYGVRNRVSEPRFLAPLDDPSALRWFMRSVFQPRTVRGAMTVRVLARGPLLPLTKLLFLDLVLVARRSATTR